MTEGSEKIADKIKKLLSKAERTTPEEAEALTEAAERLMMKYSIDQAMIDARKAKGEREVEIVMAYVIVDGIYKQALMQIAYQMALGLDVVKVCISGRYQDRKYHDAIMIVGLKSDVEQAEILFTSLMMQSMVAMRQWYKTCPEKNYMSKMELFKTRRSFFIGFGHGVRQRLDRVRLSALRSAGGGSELALRDRGALAKDWMDKNLSLTKAKGRIEVTGNGYHEGQQAGLVANTGGSSVSNKRNELA